MTCRQDHSEPRNPIGNDVYNLINPIGVATSSSAAVNIIAIDGPVKHAVYSIRAIGAGIYYSWYGSDNSTPISAITAGVAVAGNWTNLWKLTVPDLAPFNNVNGTDLTDGSLVLTDSTGLSGTIRGRGFICKPQNQTKWNAQPQDGTAPGVVWVRFSSTPSGVVATDRLYYAPPAPTATVVSGAEYLAAGATAHAIAPKWAKYLAFVREASTDATVVVNNRA